MIVFEHGREEKVGEIGECGYVDLDHVELALAVEFVEGAAQAEARVVDEGGNGKIVLLGEIEDLIRRSGIGEVGAEHVNFDIVLA